LKAEFLASYDAEVLGRKSPKFDSSFTKLRTLNRNYRLRLYLSSRLMTRSQAANGYRNFKTSVETSTTPNIISVVNVG